MLALVWDVLREFGEEVQSVEDLEVAPRAKSPLTGVGNRRQSAFSARYTTEPESVTRTEVIQKHCGGQSEVITYPPPG